VEEAIDKNKSRGDGPCVLRAAEGKQGGCEREASTYPGHAGSLVRRCGNARRCRGKAQSCLEHTERDKLVVRSKTDRTTHRFGADLT